MTGKKLLWAALPFAFLLAGCGESGAGVPVGQSPPSGANSYKEASLSVPSSAKSLSSAASEGRISIGEKMFVAQTNDVYFNPQLYLGREFQYEGIFTAYYDEYTKKTYYSVIRYGPGCCGVDSNCGFEVEWADPEKQYPAENDWVEAIGVLEEYFEEGQSYLRLRLSSLKALESRGAETVTQ
jgi:uncharacterized membrane protein YcgQ (UPF0703/DUF1980 family)